MKKLFLIDSNNRSNEQKAVLGLRKAIQIAVDEGLKNIIIVFPNIGGLDSSDLGKVIDSLGISNMTASRLRRHEPVLIGDSIDVKAISSMKITKSIGIQEVDVLIAYASTINDMKEISELYNIKNVVYIPWLDEEESYIRNQWSAIII